MNHDKAKVKISQIGKLKSGNMYWKIYSIQNLESQWFLYPYNNDDLRSRSPAQLTIDK